VVPACASATLAASSLIPMSQLLQKRMTGMHSVILP